MIHCSRCGGEFQQTNNQIRKYDRRCRRCTQDDENAWRKKRKAEGKRARWTDPEWYKRYYKLYAARPEIKKHKAELARARLRDPVQRLKAMARWTARHATTKGVLTKQACILCGGDKVDRHHPDYSKPLFVVWMCRPCHRKEHSKAKGAQ